MIHKSSPNKNKTLSNRSVKISPRKDSMASRVSSLHPNRDGQGERSMNSSPMKINAFCEEFGGNPAIWRNITGSQKKLFHKLSLRDLDLLRENDLLKLDLIDRKEATRRIKLTQNQASRYRNGQKDSVFSLGSVFRKYLKGKKQKFIAISLHKHIHRP